MRQIISNHHLFTLIEPFDQKVEGPALREHLFASPAESAPRKYEEEQEKPNKTVDAVYS